MVSYSHLFKNFLQFVGIHTVKDFGIVNKAEADVFLELSYFFNDPTDVGNLVSMLCLFEIDFEHLEVLSSCTVEALLGVFLALLC